MNVPGYMGFTAGKSQRCTAVVNTYLDRMEG